MAREILTTILSLGAIVGLFRGFEANKLSDTLDELCRSNRIIPSTENVQTGSINPNQPGIDLTDPDMNGQDEVVFRYKGVPYLAREDENGRPYFEPLGGVYGINRSEARSK